MTKVDTILASFTKTISKLTKHAETLLVHGDNITMRRKQLEAEGQQVSDERDRAMRVAEKLTALVEGE